MTLTLDAATENRIQREIDLGHYSNEAEVVAHAVTLLAAQQAGTRTSRPDAGATRAIDEVFGLWANRNIDGLGYQEAIRAEW